MRSLYHQQQADEVAHRIASLTPASPRQWGSMSAAQMMEHCSAGLEMAMGRVHPQRAPFLASLLGKIIKPIALKDSQSMRQGSPTVPELLIKHEPEFEAARARLLATLNELARAGYAGCTQHPHPFFGKMKAEEWGILMYKHLDHHLRQFSA